MIDADAENAAQGHLTRFAEDECADCQSIAEDVGYMREAADALASLRSERTQLQGLIQTWRANAADGFRFDRYERKGYKACADQLEALLSSGSSETSGSAAP